ncbi:F-box protein [Raphanus sativus]|uniref:F-box/LRR-repeat/kelch-repeat protein At1g09650-like n=1 Tax=Raphanus sativus TaxID=3726 RepID=A0A6J0LMI1_RAPSA|nr:F-box/LRR-repeat/kelch-repeat protein At1g09650-like [Raphanus sativus]KAJ4909699.1 F-box protein [Raphanus sativus]
MPKRKRDDVIISPSWEVYIPQDVVQEILIRLAVKSLLRFKAVSKTWRTEIESRTFHDRHLRHQQKSRNLSVLVFDDDNPASATFRTLSVGATSLSLENHSTYHLQLHPSTFKFSCVTSTGIQITESCDGLVCLYSTFLTYVINPATRWYRKVPESRCQARVKALLERDFIAIKARQVPQIKSFPELGFGKDNITGVYKLVWLCSSTYLNGDDQNNNTCEVFSFDSNNNTWYDVVVSCPDPVIHHMPPVHAHGSLHWLIDSLLETQMLSFDLHTETFTVGTKLPVAYSTIHHITMFTLNNRLCLSEYEGEIQTIWSFNQDNMTWDNTYSINLGSTFSCMEFEYLCAVPPITLLSDDRFLLYDFSYCEEKLVLYNYRLNSFSKFFKVPFSSPGISYYQSLVTL